MCETDDLIVDVIRSTGQLEDGRLVTDGILIYSSVVPDKPNVHGYGMVIFNEGNVGHHNLLGLLDMAHSDLLSNASGSDE